MHDVTNILATLENGDPVAAEKLLPLVYDQLRKLASQKLMHEAPGQTLQATALVHEVWMRLNGDGSQNRHWKSRGHFFGAAAEAMRRIIIDNARRKRGLRRGGHLRRCNLDTVAVVSDFSKAEVEDLEALDAALNRLSIIAPRNAELVKLRYFGGLTIAQAADVMGVSSATVERDWEYARVWLYCELSGESSHLAKS